MQNGRSADLSAMEGFEITAKYFLVGNRKSFSDPLRLVLRPTRPCIKADSTLALAVMEKKKNKSSKRQTRNAV